MSQSTPTSALGFQDFFTTTLDGSITTTDTTISLAAAPTPTEGFLVIEPDSSTNREIIMYTSVSGNDVVCGSVDDRGIGGTTAKAHSSGAIVKMNTVSDMFDALQSGSGLNISATTWAAKITGLSKSTLTTDSNPYKFSAYRNAAWTAGGGLAKVVFDTELYDTNSNFATGTYTAPVAGFYFFSAAAAVTNASDGGAHGVVIYKNGSAALVGNYMLAAGSFAMNVHVSGLVQCAANDTIEIYHDGNGKTGATGASQTWFNGFLVSRT